MSSPRDPSADATKPDRPGIDRRVFLRQGGTLLGLGALAGTGALAACTSAPSGTPPSTQGTALRSSVPPARATGTSTAGDMTEPLVRSSANGVLDTRLRVAEAEVQLGATKVNAVTYEGMYPGPTLEIRPGDKLKVQFQNDSAQPTNLHTHGLHVSPSGNSDNVFVSVNPGTTFDYEYDIPADHPAGTLWYHAHYHTLTDDQVFGGQFGLMIVRGEFDELPGIAGVPERVLIIGQTQLDEHSIHDASDANLDLQVTLVNGQYQPTIAMAPGEVQRWRILNVNPTFYRMQLAGLEMHVVAYDGNSLTEPRKIDLLELAPGMRADVLVRATSQPTTTELTSLSWEPLGQFWTSMVPTPQTLAHITIAGTPTKRQAPLPTTLLPMVDLRNATIDRQRTFRLQEREPRNTGKYDAYHYYINGAEFDHDVVNETMKLGTTEEWTFFNETYEPHPLHIHVNPFQVVSINGAPSDENHYRDTATIPPFGSLTIRHRFLDYTGKYVMHCHLLFHEDHGMMQALEVVD